MIAFLISLAPFIPMILSLVNFLIKMFGASAADMKAYADMVEKNKDSGLTAVETYKKLSGYHQEMLAEYAADEKAKADAAAAKNQPEPPKPPAA